MSGIICNYNIDTKYIPHFTVFTLYVSRLPLETGHVQRGKEYARNDGAGNRGQHGMW